MLKQRLLFGSILVLVVAWLFYVDYLMDSTWYISGLILVVTGLSLYEFYKMHENVTGPMNKTFPIIVSLIFLAAIVCMNNRNMPPHVRFFEIAVPICLGLMFIYPFIVPVLTGQPSRVSSGYVMITSFFYLVIPIIIILAMATRRGTLFLIYLILVNKTADSAAYFGGKLLGGRIFGTRKLAPNISPNKTIEGFLCALVVGVVLTYLFFNPAIIHSIDRQFCRWQEYPGWVISLGLIITLFGQIGDLVESAIKRYCGVKDSGNWLPGLGGVLDLIDSIIFSAPAMLIVIILFEAFGRTIPFD